MGFFRNLFQSPKRDGQAVLHEILQKAKDLATQLEMVFGVEQAMARRGQQFASAEAEDGVIAGLFVPFLEDATKQAAFAKRTLEDLRRGAIDVTQLQQVEYFVLLMATNALLVAGSIADAIAAHRGRDQVAAIVQLYCDPRDTLRECAANVTAFGDFAQTFCFHRDMRAPDYSEYLERVVRPEIPDVVAIEGARIYAQLTGRT